MTPRVTMNGTCSDTVACTAAATNAIKPDLSYLPTFNVAGGRPDERRGTRGSFTRGVCIMFGGPPREMPLDTELVYHGKVLFVSPTLKPDFSGIPRANTVGGRPTERLGVRGGFTPGAKSFLGGAPRDVPLEAEFLDHGKLLFVSSVLKPDMSGEARTNGARPMERLGSRGGFTPGARRWLGERPRDVPPARVLDPGTVIFRSSKPVQPNVSAIVAEETNFAGGREDERCRRLGTFEHGIVKATGGPLHMPSNSPREVELWHEGGQKENKYRRCGPGHFVAGVSILSGGMPVY
eukprot:g12583.t1